MEADVSEPVVTPRKWLGRDSLPPTMVDCSLCGARFWTTDAIYREYPEKVRMWREKGCKAINMDTSYFHAVSEVVGISVVYACVISDCVEGPNWEDGFIRARQSIGLLQDLIIAIEVQKGLFEKSILIYNAEKLLENISFLIDRAHRVNVPPGEQGHIS
jgi:hypothetical protein